jgi:hypothetical protein
LETIIFFNIEQDGIDYFFEKNAAIFHRIFWHDYLNWILQMIY